MELTIHTLPIMLMMFCFHKNLLHIIKKLQETYVLKGVGEPEYYLGGDVIDLDGTYKKEGVHTALSAEIYVQNVVEKYENLLNRDFHTRYSIPFGPDYHPKLDTTPLLSLHEASIYWGLIGSANWLITLGRFDIHYATNTLSRFGMAPYEGHFKAIKRVFSYLKKNPSRKILIDPGPHSLPTHEKQDYE